MLLKIKQYIKNRYPQIGVIKRTFLAAREYKGSSQKNNVLVLCYHRVGLNEPDPYLVNVSLECFREQMSVLREQYEILHLSDELKSKEKAVVVTFDDGCYDNYLNAFPILKENKIPATFFIPTDNLGTCKELWDQELLRLIYYRTRDTSILVNGQNYAINDIDIENIIQSLHDYLIKLKPQIRDSILQYIEDKLKPNVKIRNNMRLISKNELIDMSKNQLVEIGVHTCSHTALANLSYEEQLQEISKSKQILEEITGKNVNTIAYPFGRKNIHYNDDTLKIVDECGFTRGLTTNNKQLYNDMSMLEIPRIHVGDWDGKTFQQILKLYWKLG